MRIYPYPYPYRHTGAQTRSCGYVLQSEVLKQRAGSYPSSLRVRLISASFLPKIRTGATDDSAVPDVTATLSVHSADESKEFRTKVVSTSLMLPWHQCIYLAWCTREQRLQSELERGIHFCAQA